MRAPLSQAQKTPSDLVGVFENCSQSERFSTCSQSEQVGQRVLNANRLLRLPEAYKTGSQLEPVSGCSQSERPEKNPSKLEGFPAADIGKVASAVQNENSTRPLLRRRTQFQSGTALGCSDCEQPNCRDVPRSRRGGGGAESLGPSPSDRRSSRAFFCAKFSKLFF